MYIESNRFSPQAWDLSNHRFVTHTQKNGAKYRFLFLLVCFVCLLGDKISLCSFRDIWVLSCGMGFKSKENVVGYSRGIHATIAVMDLFCLGSHYWSSQGLQLCNIGDSFSPLVECTTLSKSVKLASRNKSSRSGLAWFIHVLWLKKGCLQQ